MEGFAMWISGFIAIVILLSIAPVILGTATLSDCSTLQGYDAKGKSTNSTGWAKSCYSVAKQAVQAFDLLLVVLIVMAAAVILRVVGFIGA